MSECSTQRNNLKWLVADPRARSIARVKSRIDITTVTGLADYWKMAHSNVVSAHSDLSNPVQSKIANLYDIPRDSTCWQAFCNGNHEQLREEFYELHPNPISAVPGELDIANEGLESLETTEPTFPLASLDLYLQQVAAGDPSPVSVDLICQPIPVERLEMAVKRGWLELDCRNATGPRTNERAGYPEPVLVERATGSVRVAISNSPQQHPRWEITSLEGPIGMFRVGEEFKCVVSLETDDGNTEIRSFEESLCVIRNLSPGDKVTARFMVYVKDLEALNDLNDPGPEEQDDEDEESEGVTRSFLRTDEKPLTEMARKIIKRATEKQALSGSASELAIIAVATSERKD